MTDYTPPTQDEIQRVAAHWRRVKALGCTHPTLTFGTHLNAPECRECGRPIRALSDIQIEEMKRRAPLTDDVRDRLLTQMDRGGVRFAVEGQWYDSRFIAHGYDGEDPASERIVMLVDDVALMLRATEA